jgi:CheY-like chemotaxis protein
MSLKEKIDVLDFLIAILKEHEESLYEITQRLEKLSDKLDNGELKAESQEVLEVAKKELSKPRPGRSNILIVDDDDFLTETFKVILETVGYNIDISSTGMHALHLTKEKTYDLVLMDIKLPDINGDEVARIIRKQGGKTNIILMTGYEKLAKDFEEDPVQVNELLMKPISPTNLLTVTKMVLEKNK